jgi:long-chain acyl-CoA synthetase
LIKKKGMSSTIKEMLLQSVAQFGSETALLFKENKKWRTIKYDRLLHRTKCVSELLRRHGVEPGDRVALWRENHPDWAESYLGIVCMGAIAVPIDAKLRPQEITHILQDSETKVLLTGAKFYPLISEIEQVLDFLKVVIITEKDTIEPESDRLEYIDYHTAIEEVWSAADNTDSAFNQCHSDSEDLASLIYTSGTTGRAKGVMLSHGNFMSNVNGAGQVWPFGPKDNFLLVLPLHHAFAFTGNFLLPLAVGARISFVENLRTVGDNMREVSPTFFMAVPLLLEKMYSKMMAGVEANRAASLMMKLGMGKIVGRGVVKKLGGSLKVIITGAAPCDPEIIIGFRKLGIYVLEGYGLTEAAPVLTINLPDKFKPGTVGIPFSGVDIDIRDPN